MSYIVWFSVSSKDTRREIKSFLRAHGWIEFHLEHHDKHRKGCLFWGPVNCREEFDAHFANRCDGFVSWFSMTHPNTVGERQPGAAQKWMDNFDRLDHRKCVTPEERAAAEETLKKWEAEDCK